MNHRDLYFAYGANLNLAGMSNRCPSATALCAFTLEDFRLVFRCVADIEPAKGQTVQGALYRLTRTDELALDRFEGFHRVDPRTGMYRKEYFEVRNRSNGEVFRVMYYAMNSGRLARPSDSYFNTILRGYRDWDLDAKALYRAAGKEAAYLG